MLGVMRSWFVFKGYGCHGCDGAVSVLGAGLASAGSGVLASVFME